MMTKVLIHSSLAPIASVSLSLPLEHWHAHPVFNTLKISFSRTDPGSANLPLDFLLTPMFLEYPFLQFINLFIFFSVSHPTLLFFAFFRHAQNRQFQEAYSSKVKIKCCFSFQQVLSYRTYHHESCFTPRYISVLLCS